MLAETNRARFAELDLNLLTPPVLRSPAKPPRPGGAGRNSQEVFASGRRMAMLMSSRLLYVLWLLSILLVITGSLLPASSPAIRAIGRLPVSSKVLHFCAYTWLALLALLAIKRRSLAVPAALAMILLGVALEFGQKLVPGREFEIRDMFINGAGVLTGFAIGILSRRVVPVVSSS